jgi:hypothetical protein
MAPANAITQLGAERRPLRRAELVHAACERCDFGGIVLREPQRNAEAVDERCEAFARYKDR